MEEWRPVPGYEDLYEVSDLGRVRRIKGGQGATAGRVLKGRPSPKGYVYVYLYRNDARVSRSLHGLVASVFCGTRPPGTTPNHIDGNKKNNRSDNLEWLTQGDNNRHAYRTGLKRPTDNRGEKHPRAKLSPSQVLEIREARRLGVPQRKLATVYAVSRSTIQFVESGERWGSV